MAVLQGDRFEKFSMESTWATQLLSSLIRVIRMKAYQDSIIGPGRVSTHCLAIALPRSGAHRKLLVTLRAFVLPRRSVVTAHSSVSFFFWTKACSSGSQWIPTFRRCSSAALHPAPSSLR